MQRCIAAAASDTLTEINISAQRTAHRAVIKKMIPLHSRIGGLVDLVGGCKYYIQVVRSSLQGGIRCMGSSVCINISAWVGTRFTRWWWFRGRCARWNGDDAMVANQRRDDLWQQRPPRLMMDTWYVKFRYRYVVWLINLCNIRVMVQLWWVYFCRFLYNIETEKKRDEFSH